MADKQPTAFDAARKKFFKTNLFQNLLTVVGVAFIGLGVGMQKGLTNGKHGWLFLGAVVLVYLVAAVVAIVAMDINFSEGYVRGYTDAVDDAMKKLDEVLDSKNKGGDKTSV